MNKDSFIFYRDWYLALNSLEDAVRYEVYDALMRKAFEDEDSVLSSSASIAMSFITPLLERDKERYKAICEQRKAFGKRGGVAKASKSYQKQASATKSKQNVASVADNDIQDTNVSMSISNNNLKEKETNVSNKKKSIFIPPSLFEVVEYVHEKGYHFDAEKFHAYYESNGWMVGRNKMKDWKAACRTWEKNSQNNSPSLFSQETEMNQEPKKPEWE